MDRHLLAFSLVAGSLLAADSLAINQSPLWPPSYGSAPCSRGERRRPPSWRFEKESALTPSPLTSSLLASSDSQASADNDLVDTVNCDHDSTTPHSNQKKAETETSNSMEESLSIWPQLDDLDKRMMKIALPCIGEPPRQPALRVYFMVLIFSLFLSPANFAINP